jgi:threonyl-tRNA synthetase
MNDQDKLYPMRHSLAHIMATAVTNLYPGAKLGVGPVVDNGFYYDIDIDGVTISEKDFKRIEKEMRAIINRDEMFVKSDKAVDEAIMWAKEAKQSYKEELLNDLKRSGTTIAKDLDVEELGLATDGDAKIESVSFYTNGDFTDLCRGPHVESTGKVGAFKLMRVAGAYWRGKEGNPQMQRLYGVAFESQEELDRYLANVELAKERDHRKLGKELDLFVFSDLVGPGLPLYTPRGTVVRNLLTRLMQQANARNGSQEVSIPYMARRRLYEISGHAQKFSGELFNVESHYDIDFVMKPVNCPHHIQLYASQPRSYRELPISYTEITAQYRDEKPGQIGGLQRTRGFTVDDGHIFLAPENIPQVIREFCAIIEEVHSGLGMYGDHWVSLSLRDPGTPEAYVGDEADWNEAESMLKRMSQELNLDAKPMEGEAALYGPKLDFMYSTLMGKETQLATIQLDFATPKRFGLTYIDANGEEKTPIMVHRAILGSLERFMVILLEKTGGWLPFWLAPEQVRIVTVNETVNDYVKQVTDILDDVVLMSPVKYNELRYTVDNRNESLGKKIREASKMKIPVQLVIGPQDAEAGEVSVRLQDGESKVKLAELVEYLKGL